jgi:hypothetical protein
MKRGLRHILTLLAVASSTLLIVLFFRSQHFEDVLCCNHLWGDDSNSYRLFCGGRSEDGRLYLFLHTEHRKSEDWSLLRDPCARPTGFTRFSAPLSFNSNLASLPWISCERYGTSLSAHLLLPHWIFSVIFASMAAMPWLRRRSYANSHGLICPNCGYDLRATPARCPECGKESQRFG